MRRKFSIAMVSALLLACGQEEQILLPENIDVEWDASYNALGDGLGAVVPVDIMVYDAATGEPLPGVELDLQVNAKNAYLMETTEVMPLVAACSDCDVLWDAYRDEYYEVQPDLSDDLSRIRLEADEGGLAHFYVVVDAFATQMGSHLSIQVRAETDSAYGTLYLQPR